MQQDIFFEFMFIHISDFQKLMTNSIHMVFLFKEVVSIRT